MKTPVFHKTTVYSKMLILKDGEHKIKAVRHKGWSDNTYHYYQNERDEKWYAIDPMCGFSIIDGNNRKEAYRKVRDEDIQKAFKQLKETDKYTQMCSEWYKLQVEAGIIMENPIK